ncbi:helix-turn-helix domain-containing protein [Streptomyces sp. AK08-02]|uniref:PucR family transcriptional regulator n=1 Tax=Streptomyces sp. AK08-02 TaxID=3028654 RepID=UPI0029A65757|nr:helix-turn-helix domain-containing protein [Streptomyces sp. AK08-02]MDX3749691.1 helix-turn-helix domain-containing protein [Streptomyces sp. AK08-02]
MTALTDFSGLSERPERSEGETVAEVLRAMAADAGVQGELVRAARKHSPEVARLAEAETLWHVTAMINAAGAWLGAPDGRDPGTDTRKPRTDTTDRGDSEQQGVDAQDFAAALLLGADRAGQGVPMTAVLRGVQAAHTRAVEITVDRCRAAGVPDAALLSVVLRLKEYGDALQRHVVHGYRVAEGDNPHELGEARARLLRRLLVEGEPPPDMEELAGAGLRRDAVRHLLVADPGGEPARTRRLAHRLAALRGCLFGTLDGRLVGLYPRLPAGETIEDWDGGGGGDAESAEEEACGGAFVVVSPAVPLDDLRATYGLCVRALDLDGGTAPAPYKRHGVYELTELAAEIALADQPFLGAWLSARLLADLDPRDDFHRQIAVTALAFLDHGRRLDRTAATLFTHPNTVRYRLSRLQQLTGESLTDDLPGIVSGPLGSVHWWWALRTWLESGSGRKP